MEAVTIKLIVPVRDEVLEKEVTSITIPPLTAKHLKGVKFQAETSEGGQVTVTLDFDTTRKILCRACALTDLVVDQISAADFMVLQTAVMSFFGNGHQTHGKQLPS